MKIVNGRVEATGHGFITFFDADFNDGDWNFQVEVTFDSGNTESFLVSTSLTGNYPLKRGDHVEMVYPRGLCFPPSLIKVNSKVIFKQGG